MGWGEQIHIAAATLNQTVGDWSGNLARIERAINEARRRGARVLVLPEMTIPGYNMGDRLLRRGTLQRSWSVLQRVAEAAGELVVCAGLPVRYEGVVYNAMAVVSGGTIHGVVCKENLATGDVEYESRWYQPWQAGRVVDFVGPDGGAPVPMGNLIFELGQTTTLALEICEDGWMGLRPGSRYAVAGAEILANPSASWFAVGKHAVRRRMCEQISLEDHCVYVYTSLAGCDATRLVFDGTAFITCEGAVIREADRFVFDDDVHIVDVVQDLGELRQRRMESGSWRQQVRALSAGAHGGAPHRVRIEGDFEATASADASAPYWIRKQESSVDPSLEHFVRAGLFDGPITFEELSHVELELALCLGLRDYLSKTGVGGYCLALSGGRDSAMVALLVRRMFRYDNPTLDAKALDDAVRQRFVCAYMATRNSSQHTRDAARSIAEDCGAEFMDGDIDDVVGAVSGVGQAMLGKTLSWEIPAEDIALQNVQARARSAIIWMIANVRGRVLLATSNKSEAAVGYATMDGDTSGGLSPIADVPKSLIQLWLAWACQRHGFDGVSHVLSAPASAELRPQEKAQTDEDDLMPFEVLDQLMDHFVQKAMDPREIFARLWPTFKARYGGDRIAFADHIARFVRMLCRAQWKRERFAISFRVMPFDLDPKGGFRFPPVQSGFRDELEEMYALARQTEA